MPSELLVSEEDAEKLEELSSEEEEIVEKITTEVRRLLRLHISAARNTYFVVHSRLCAVDGTHTYIPPLYLNQFTRTNLASHPQQDRK